MGHRSNLLHSYRFDARCWTSFFFISLSRVALLLLVIIVLFLSDVRASARMCVCACVSACVFSVCVCVCLNNFFLRKPSNTFRPCLWRDSSTITIRWLRSCILYRRISTRSSHNLTVSLNALLFHLFFCCCLRSPVSGLLCFMTNTINGRPSIKGQWIFTHYPCYNTLFFLV